MRLLAALLLPLAALGQFRELTTTDDGAQLYFTSRVRQKGSQQYSHDKIFRYNVDHFELFAQEDYKGPDYEAGRLSNFYRLNTAMASADGTAVSFLAERDCRGGSGCLPYELYQTHLRRAGSSTEQLVNGRVRISRNGRYLLQIYTIGPTSQTWLIDQQTNTLFRISGASRARQAITLDGVVVGSDSDNAITLYSAAGVQRIPVTFRPLGLLYINDPGTWVVSDYEKLLRTVDVRTGREYLLGVTAFESFGASIARDGTVLYVSETVPGGTPQVQVSSPTGSSKRQLTDEPEGIAEAVIAGYGSVAYAVTRFGRLLKIDVASGRVQELTGATPSITQVFGAAAAGSFNWILGSGFSTGSAIGQAPAPESLAGVRVMVGETAARLLVVSPGELRFQIPWETADPAADIRVERDNSDFEATITRTASVRGPTFIRIESGRLSDFGEAIVIHQRFESLVSSSDPAALGEIVHLYATGLGPVSPTVRSGEPAPAAPPSQAVQALVCSYQIPNGSLPLEVTFAGLAPGTVGIYQVSVRLPMQPSTSDSGSSTGTVGMQCGTAEAPSDFVTIPVALR